MHGMGWCRVHAKCLFSTPPDTYSTLHDDDDDEPGWCWARENQQPPECTTTRDACMHGGWIGKILWFEFKFIPKLTPQVNVFHTYSLRTH
jgi:hypothetical protein